MKACSRCKQVFEDTAFNWKFKHLKRATYCRECSREYIRDHYERNTEYYVKKAEKRNIREKIKQINYVGNYLLKHPCLDCGEKDIVVLEFDHKDKSVKSDEVSNLIKRKFPLRTIKEEIEKCEVRCANCHRRKTARENNNWKLTFASVA